MKPGVLYTLALPAALVLALLAGWLPSTVQAQSEAVELVDASQAAGPTDSAAHWTASYDYCPQHR